MAAQTYEELMKQDLNVVIDALDLTDLQKSFLRSRWLDQVQWMEGRAKSGQVRYYALRMIVIIGAVVVPALVSLDASRWIGAVLSTLVAVSAAMEEFFRYGERWRHYRRTSELLKTEGWQFLQLSGSYSEYESHAKAHTAFVAQVEKLNQTEAEKYITEITREQKKE